MPPAIGDGESCARNTAILWAHDKRPCNGSALAYFGMVSVPLDAPVVQTLIDYTRGALDAVGIKNGP